MAHEFLAELGLEDMNSGVAGASWMEGEGPVLESFDPGTGETIASVRQATREQYEQVVGEAVEAFKRWRRLPAPKRGDMVRQCGELMRAKKDALGRLVSLEMGKILPEGLGEVQEAIDIADYAVGLSRQLYGVSTKSERQDHRLFEQWHPLGPVGCITAFNFPIAVWAWNSMIALVCGDPVIWKPSEKTPLVAIAASKLLRPVFEAEGLGALLSLVVGELDAVGKPMVADKRLPIISATGSCRMGKEVAPVVAARMGRSILELGGNNALIVMNDADLDLSLRAVVFGAVGTAGQRCTTTRRLLLQRGAAEGLIEKLVAAYKTVPIGHPLADGTLMGPLIDKGAVEGYKAAIEAAREQGGELLTGGEVLTGEGYESGCYVQPAIVKATKDMEIVNTETFAPILYILPFDTLEEAIALQNSVDQGLSSAIFTQNLIQAEEFLCSTGSDCGIANVNLGTSGAEIGLAFGGEKETGGGREAGSDAWKAYMRRQTNTINYGRDLPLAQGIQFG